MLPPSTSRKPGALARRGRWHSIEALDAAIAQLRRDKILIEVTARGADTVFVTD